MLKKLTIYFVMAVLCPFLGFAQEGGTQGVRVDEVKLGEFVPDVLLTSLHNYKDVSGQVASSAKLSDFKGKLLILDFWATWCGPCVQMIPKMDSLQQEFGDKVTFLSVSYQADQEVLPFLARLEQNKGRKFSLPILNGSTTLKKLFPHHSLPHYVWIGADGKFLAATEFDKISSVHIDEILMGKGVDWVYKQDVPRRPYDKNLPMFIGNNAGAPGKMLYHSMLTGFTEGMGSGSSYYGPSYQYGQKITARNLNLRLLYSLAYSDYKTSFGANRLIFEVKDVSKISNESQGMEFLNWMRQGNGFCYELIVPAELKDSAFSIMRQDLDRVFVAYKIGVEVRDIDCWVLKKMDSSKNLSSNGSAPLIKLDRMGAKLVNVPLSKLVNSLDRFYLQESPYPIVDATGISFNVDLELNCSLSSIAELNKELVRYGLEFVKEKSPTEVLVFRDNNLLTKSKEAK